MQKPNVVPISEARPNLAGLIDEANRGGEPIFVASRSKVKAVIMGIDEYEGLRERLEDLEDSLEILTARAAGEPSRPYEEFLAELRDDQRRNVPRRA